MKLSLKLASVIAAAGVMYGASLVTAEPDSKSSQPEASASSPDSDKKGEMSPGHGMDDSQMPGNGQGMMMGGGMMGRMKGRRGMMGMMGAGCPMMGMMMGDMMGDGETPSFSAGRIAFLKAELLITEAQQKVWEAYADALKQNLQGMQDMHKTMMKAMMGKTPVDKLDAHVSAMESHLSSLKQIKPALGALYEALSNEQRKKADELLTGMGCMT